MAVNPSVKKRQKEQQRKEHQSEKAAKRDQRRTDKGPRDESGEDPDLAGITPGPHNTPEPV